MQLVIGPDRQRRIAGYLKPSLVSVWFGAIVLGLGAAKAQGTVTPPGTLVDIGGQRLHVNCTGTGSPTVLLESGLGDVSVIWALVQPTVSTFTRVCSYDRGGYGWSDPGGRPRTFAQLPLELHTALDRMGVAGPYVLVGQSYGGLVVRGFAARYRPQVVGMVLVDAVHEDQRVVYGGQPHRIRDDAKGRVAPPPRIALDTELMRQARSLPATPRPAAIEAPMDRLPAAAQTALRWTEAQPLLTLAQQAETDWSPEELQRMHDGRLKDRVTLGDLPLIVLARTHGGYDDGMTISADSLERERRNLQADLAKLSHKGTLVFAPHSGHNIHVEDPELVIESIRKVVLAARQPEGALDSLPHRLSAYMKPYTAMRDFSGRILVAYRGAVVLDSAFTAPEDGISTPDTRFGIGSVTKTFTAAAVCLLAERGKLRLSDSLGKFIPELSAGKRATIQQTLAHAAGIPDYYTQPDYPRLRSSPITLEGFARWIGAKPLDFEPGTHSSYSNSGYALLALVVERASGRPYARFVEEELLRPNGLQSTGQLTTVSGSLAPGHDPAPAPRYLKAPTPVDLSWLAGSGSMYSTTGDLLRWVTALRSDRVLAFSKLPYAYGWHVEGDSVLEQNGRIPAGYTTQLTAYPKQDLTIVILSDIQADVVGRINDDITAMVLGRPYRVPAMRTAVALPDSVASRYAGTYEFGPGFDVKVRLGEKSLELAGPEGDFFPLDPVGQGRFFFRPVYVPVSFARDSAGRDVLIWNGVARAPRVTPH